MSYLIKPPAIDVTNIEFDWKNPLQSTDPTAAITIRKSLAASLDFKRPPADPGNTGNTFGEWVKGGVNDPVLFVADKMVSIKVRFTSSSNFLLKADISAKALAGKIPDVSSATVNFNAGVSSPQYVQMSLASATNNFIEKVSETWQWQLGNLNGCGTPLAIAPGVTSGPHTVYTVLDVPKTPWYDKASQQPWVSALDFVTEQVPNIGDGISVSDAAASITNFLFSDYGLVYDSATADLRSLPPPSIRWSSIRCCSRPAA